MTDTTVSQSQCKSCGGLNTSCPDGCGRDPKTGELNGSRCQCPHCASQSPPEQAAQNDAVREACEKAANWFDEYADQHAAKSREAVDSYERGVRTDKAKRNRERADYLRAALATPPAPLEGVEDAILAAIRAHGAVIIEPMGDGLGWTAMTDEPEDREWHDYPLRATASSSPEESGNG